MYAGRKRRKPVQKTHSVKQPPTEGLKSNPSKRHRDRLNSELDHLASLLPFPEEVRSSLDKLSILRLSVSYLRAKSFFSVALKNHACKEGVTNVSNHEDDRASELVDSRVPEGELLLQALHGFVLVVTTEGTVFYCSHTIEDYLGFHQTDVMYQSIFDLVHTEDQQEFRRNLHWALNPPYVALQKDCPDDDSVGESALVICSPRQLPPEDSTFLERSFVCRFRCLLDNSTGFLAMNLQGRLKFLHGQKHRLDDGSPMPSQLALFAVATPLQPLSILEIRTKNMIFRTKHKLDFTPTACDAKGKVVLGYTEAELRVRGSGYQFVHAADMLHCAENHMRMIKTGESGLTVFRLLTKENQWRWVQSNARLVFKNGKPSYIIATQRPLVDEEGGEYLQKRTMQFPFTFTTGEALLYQTSHPMSDFSDSIQNQAGCTRPKHDRCSRTTRGNPNPSSVLGTTLSQDESVYVCQPALEQKLCFYSGLLAERDGSGGPICLNTGEDDGRMPDSGTVTVDSQARCLDLALPTLDSLTLEGSSSSEHFDALENQGLHLEDLEPLLLDQQMIQVEMEPGYIPSLNDLLTNDEILSYIHDFLEGRTESSTGADDVMPHPRTPNAQPQLSDSTSFHESKSWAVPSSKTIATEYLCSQPKPAPYIQFPSQIKQQSSRQQADVKLNTTSHPQSSLSMDHGGRTPWELNNSQWVDQQRQGSLDLQEGIKNQQPSVNCTNSQEAIQHQQNHVYVQVQHQQCLKQSLSNIYNCSSQYSHLTANMKWQGYSYSCPASHQNQDELSGQILAECSRKDLVPPFSLPHPSHTSASYLSYNMAANPTGKYTVNSQAGPYQELVDATSANQMAQQAQQPLPHPSFYVTSNFPQNILLEQIVGTKQSQQLFSMESHGTFPTFPQKTSQSKLEGRFCGMPGTSVAYTTGCLLSNGNPAAPSGGPTPLSEALPSVPDPGPNDSSSDMENNSL